MFADYLHPGQVYRQHKAFRGWVLCLPVGEDIKSWRLPKHNPLTTSGVSSSLETLSRMF